jgi:hypothetical protein
VERFYDFYSGLKKLNGNNLWLGLGIGIRGWGGVGDHWRGAQYIPSARLLGISQGRAGEIFKAPLNSFG